MYRKLMASTSLDVIFKLQYFILVTGFIGFTYQVIRINVHHIEDLMYFIYEYAYDEFCKVCIMLRGLIKEGLSHNEY